MLRFTLILLLFMNLSSCVNKVITNDDIDKFISKYKNENFENLKGIFISIRSFGFNEIVYVVHELGDNKPPYFVEFNIATQSITKINKNLLEKDSISDYLTQKEITYAVHNIRKYHFFLLGIDSVGNVFINPFVANEPAFFLRLKAETGVKIIRKGYVYELYKDNWYLNRTK